MEKPLRLSLQALAGLCLFANPGGVFAQQPLTHEAATAAHAMPAASPAQVGAQQQPLGPRGDAVDPVPVAMTSSVEAAIKSLESAPPGAGPALPAAAAPAGLADPAPPAAEESALINTEIAPAAERTVDSAESAQDLWMRVRRGYAMPSLDSDAVKRWEQYYLRNPEYLQRMFERGGRYLFHIVEEASQRSLPTELALLPFIESAFNPHALSSARASGIWQFMPATGRHFDLRQNLFRDDRRSVLDSTRAALDYLSQLYRLFGDWHLALSAYNWGQGNVARAQSVNRQRGLGTSYRELSMPDETRNYVPKLQAIVNLVGRPEQFGLQLPALKNHPYFLTVSVDRDIDVALAARLAGISLEDFQALNPQLNKPVILAAGTPKLLLPFENARRYQRQVVEHRGPLASWTAWVAPRTLRPADAAKLVGMAEQQLRDVNRIPPRVLLQAGSTLLVPRGHHVQRDVSVHLADTASLSLVQERLHGRKRTVKVGPQGETVAALARRYRVSPQQLASWNNVSPGSSFKAGQSVTLLGPAPRAAATAASPRNKAAARGSAKPAQRGSAASKQKR